MANISQIISLDTLEAQIMAFTAEPDSQDVFRVFTKSLERIYGDVRFCSLDICINDVWQPIVVTLTAETAFDPVNMKSAYKTADLAFRAPIEDDETQNNVTRLAHAYKNLATIATLLLSKAVVEGVNPEIYRRTIKPFLLVTTKKDGQPIDPHLMKVLIRYDGVGAPINDASKSKCIFFAARKPVTGAEVTFGKINSFLPRGSEVRVVIAMNTIVICKQTANLRPEAQCVNRITIGTGSSASHESAIAANVAAMLAMDDDGAVPAPSAKPIAKKKKGAMSPTQSDCEYCEIPETKSEKPRLYHSSDLIAARDHTTPRSGSSESDYEPEASTSSAPSVPVTVAKPKVTRKPPVKKAK